MKQALVIIVSLFVIYLGASQKDTLVSIVETGSFYAIPISIVFVSLLVFFPVLPYPILAGMIGSVFGIWVGLGISLIGIAFGTMVMFMLARFGFQKWTQQTLNKYPKVKAYEGMFNQNAFLGIVLVRLIPVVPSLVVNILCGVSIVPSYKFLVASLIGKLPAVFIFTFAGSVFEQNKIVSVLIYGIYFFLIAILIGRKMMKMPEVKL
ncbi:VTT domain-containing protein [Mesobacillus maritimus]|uniref:TVP38/TMEM64 family protein n=1 Tax=Mesobacillus maritimus TaxID=1643336 RepID=UPI00203D04ED|nr:VTT domain-containing protein [Mesobacillus maritimus]MCM3669757.1 VTT domain-containing protein [Mesobacillus maritimus]